MSEQVLIKPSLETLGAKVTEHGVSFGVWAPFAESVSVIGSFNEWSPNADKLERQNGEYWFGTVGHAQVGQEYKFVIKNGSQTLKHNDPRSFALTPGGDNSVIADPSFDWSDGDFKIPARNEQVIYELHVGTFNRRDPAQSGTFETVMEKLDYLKELGINVIELMPSSSMWTDRGWGYAPNYIYSIEAAYGGRRGFCDFVQAAHQRGIAVIMDVVYNHFGPQENYELWQFDGWSENGKGGVYFYNDWRSSTPWGETRPDYGRPEVRQYILDNVRMWMSACHVDGLRVDSTIYMRNTLGQNNDPDHDIPDGWRMLQEITEAATTLKPGAILIAEDVGVNEYITKPATEGGAGFGAQWELAFPVRLREVLDPTSDSDRHLGGLRDLIEGGNNKDHLQRVIFSESHDADANGHKRLNSEISPENSDSIYARRRSNLAAALVFTSPGIPMLFQGQEFMEDGWFSDWRALDWTKVGTYHGTVQLYHDLIALRRNLEGLTSGLLGKSFDALHQDESTKVLAFHRWDKGGAKDDVVVAVNFSNDIKTDYTITFPRPGTWVARFNSDWKGYGQDFNDTPTPEVKVEKDSGKINLGPYSAVIFSQDA